MTDDSPSADSPFRLHVAAGAILAAAGVALGAFGAHGLRGVVTPGMLAVFETGVRYQMYHAVGLIASGAAGMLGLAPRRRLLMAAGWSFGVGTILFSGSLYALSLTGLRGFGAITPAGGILFLAGWLLFAAAFALRT